VDRLEGMGIVQVVLEGMDIVQAVLEGMGIVPVVLGDHLQVIALAVLEGKDTATAPQATQVSNLSHPDMAMILVTVPVVLI